MFPALRLDALQATFTLFEKRLRRRSHLSVFIASILDGSLSLLDYLLERVQDQIFDIVHNSSATCEVIKKQICVYLVSKITTEMRRCVVRRMT